MWTWSCKALSPGQKDPLRVSKQLGNSTKWCSGKPDLVGCAWWTRVSRELARKHWLGAQLKRQTPGPELYSSTIGESPIHCCNLPPDTAINIAIPTGLSLQPSLLINVMSCRGHVSESFQWIPGMKIPFGQKSPKRSSRVLCKSTHEWLLWTTACPERTESLS